jgi:hypothetical protein
MQLELRLSHRDRRPREAHRMALVGWLPSVAEFGGLATALALMIGMLLIKIIPTLVLHPHR